MLNRRIVLGLALSGVLFGAGCAGNKWRTSYDTAVDPAVSKGWRVSVVDVRVPRSLSVSEANTYAPDANIVWRGEPFGDRYVQVDKIITEAATRGSARLRGGKPVRLVITVSTFHAVTERTRYTLENAGVHNISFTAQIFDANNGAPLTAPEFIRSDLIAYSGAQALAAEARGETQKARITSHVANTIAGWLGAGPDVRQSFSRRGR